MNLAAIDLNLLLVFDAVMRERHVTRAGDKIGMSQPAMSNALNRLRHHLKDDLFIRGPDGMQPTPRALEVAGPIRDALERIEIALDQSSFDPKTAHRRFLIGTNDYFVTTLLPHLVQHLQQSAPGIDLCLVPSAGRTLQLLDAGELDFGIAAFGEIPERFGTESLIEDSYVLMMRKGHPLSKGRLSIPRYAAARHLLMSPRGDPSGFVDRALLEHGLTRQIAVTINSFSSAPALLASSDLVLTAPKRIADTFAPLYDIATRPAPFAGPREYATATLVWHNRLASHPAHEWFRTTIVDIANAV